MDMQLRGGHQKEGGQGDDRMACGLGRSRMNTGFGQGIQHNKLTGSFVKPYAPQVDGTIQQSSKEHRHSGLNPCIVNLIYA